ncbi:MAG: hypothetical protein E3J72_22025 [Planctomycetota bacterium]|nr:MAG: hypothetical protein E3J72_22025 [Planctomycetota bacterium]
MTFEVPPFGSVPVPVPDPVPVPVFEPVPVPVGVVFILVEPLPLLHPGQQSAMELISRITKNIRVVRFIARFSFQLRSDNSEY